MSSRPGITRIGAASDVTPRAFAARVACAFDTGSLDVGDRHVLHYEQVGTPRGTPVVYLGPLDAAWKLQRAWPGSELIVVDDEGHGGATMGRVGAVSAGGACLTVGSASVTLRQVGRTPSRAALPTA
jgi:hypothetical protein